jgi:CheY-like chemotaxis protein
VDTLNKHSFLKHLRDALNHLNDPGYLRRSPLSELFDVADQFNTPSALRQILTEAIEALEPEADAPPESRAWRIFESVYYRYVQDFGQGDVADQIGISTRQLRREQRAALEALTYQLWEKFDLDGKSRKGDQGNTANHAFKDRPAISRELTWLETAPPGVTTDPLLVIPATLQLLHPLTEQNEVNLYFAADSDTLHIAADPALVRHALLNLLGVLIPRVPSHGRIQVCVRASGWEVAVETRCTAMELDLATVQGDEKASLQMAQQLADLGGGKLVLLNDGKDTIKAVLILPAAEQLPVLVIDDNAGTLRLFQRFTSGTRYRIVGLRDPEQAIQLAQELSPQIIVLDVMMPNVDGWELLGRLRQHPSTADIPVLVCTILPQETLALSLGASAFVRKPITRQVFLSALDHQLASTC